MRRTKEDAAITRQDIMKAALNVFSACGFSATRLDDIAEAAGVTRGAIYWHFHNKADLYNSLISEIVTRSFAEEVDQAIEEGGTVSEIFRRVGIRIIDMVERNPELRAATELMSHKTEAATPELEEVFRAKIDIVEQAIVRTAEYIQLGLERGEYEFDGDAIDIARAWWAIRHGITELWLLNPKAFSLIEKAPMVVDLFMRAIAPKKEDHN